MAGQTPRLLDFGDNSAGHHRRTGRRAGLGLPSTGNRHTFVDSLHRVVEIAHEVAAAQLAIGKDLEAEILLPFDDSQDVLVLKRAQLRGVRIRVSRLQELRGSQQAADVIGAISSRHKSSCQADEKGPPTSLRSTASLQRTQKYASARRSIARLASGLFDRPVKHFELKLISLCQQFF